MPNTMSSARHASLHPNLTAGRGRGPLMGGPIAVRFAARHPYLAEAIALVGGAT